MKKHISFFACIIFILLGFSGCSPLGIKVQTTGNDIQSGGTGGIYRSRDGGANFEQASYVRTVNGVAQTIGYANIRFLISDPSDTRTVYALTDDGSAWVSYAFGDTWNKIFSSSRRIEALVVAPSDRSRLYLAGGRSIMVSEDAGANWKRIYYDPGTETVITSLAVDYTNPKVLYAGTATGAILQTRDGGETWFVPVRLSYFGTSGRVHKLITVPQNPSRLYAVVVDGLQLFGFIYISHDQGNSWQKNSALDSLVRSSKYGDFERDPRSGALYYASLYGLFISRDEGNIWEQVPLLTADHSSMIYSIAIDPQDRNHIIYATTSTIVISQNQGKEWKSLPLPSFGGRVARDILISNDVSADVLIATGVGY